MLDGYDTFTPMTWARTWFKWNPSVAQTYWRFAAPTFTWIGIMALTTLLAGAWGMQFKDHEMGAMASFCLGVPGGILATLAALIVSDKVNA